MTSISAYIGKDHYRTEITSIGQKKLIADESLEGGGQNAGFSASQLFCASLAACTCITLRMYADRKQWDLEKVDVLVLMERNTESNTTAIKREIHLTGNLPAAERNRLLAMANKCPIHEIMTHPISIDTVVK